MQANSKCPSVRELRALVEAELAEDRLERIDRHVAQCISCQAQLDTMTEDAFSSVIGRSSYAGRSAELESVIQNLKSDPMLREPGQVTRSSQFRFPDPPSQTGPLGAIGRYKIVQRIGTGASGLLFEAWDSELQRRVAIKLLRDFAERSASQRTRLLREARAAVKLDHDNVVKVYDAVERNDVAPFIVLELITGGSLLDLLADHGRLPSKEAAELALQAARGLAAAHETGLVHRDVKPSNLLLRQSNNTQQVCVADFGLVSLRDEESTLTRTGELAGTPAYMSPEQVDHPSSLDGRSDVYALGCVLYELLTGRPPFEGTVRMVLWQVVHEEPKLPSRFDEGISQDLETICMKAMSKRIENRYETCQEFAEDLERFIKGESILAKPPSRLQRMWRTALRHPVRSTLIVTSLVTVLLIASISTISALRLAAARKQTSAQAELAKNGREVALDAMESIVFDAYDALDRADMDPDELQIRLLESAARGFSKIDDDDEPETLIKRAETHQRLARAMWRLQRLQPALQQIQNAETLLARTKALDSQNDDLELQVLAIKATVQLDLQHPAVEDSLKRGTELIKQLEQNKPINKQVIDAGTSLLQDKAYWLSGQGIDPTSAFKRAIELHLRLGPVEKTSFDEQALRMQLMEELADEHYNQDDLSQANAAYDKLLSVANRLKRAENDGIMSELLVADFRYYIASALCGKALCQLDAGRARAAEELFEAAYSNINPDEADLLSAGETLILAEEICNYALQMNEQSDNLSLAVSWSKRRVKTADANQRIYGDESSRQEYLSQQIDARRELADLQARSGDSRGKAQTDVEIRRLAAGMENL